MAGEEAMESSSSSIGDDLTVAVAVGRSDSSSWSSSRRAVRWAANNLMPYAHRFLLLHVTPFADCIPTPLGNHIPVKQMRGDVVDIYRQDMKIKFEENFLPFKRLFRNIEMETLVLDDDNPGTALVRYLYGSCSTILVLGSSSSNCILRKLKGPDVPSIILKLAPTASNIFVISRNKITTKLAHQTILQHEMTTKVADLLIMHESSKNSKMDSSNQSNEIILERNFDKQKCNAGSKGIVAPKALKQGVNNKFSQSLNSLDSPACVDGITRVCSMNKEHQEENCQSLEIEACVKCDMGPTTRDEAFVLPCINQADAETEMQRLQLQLQNTLAMYTEACEDLAYARNKVQLLVTECSNDVKKVKDAMEREEILNKVVVEEKAKHLEAIKEIEEARQLLVKEAHERQLAEMTAIIESSERKKAMNSLLSADRRYRRYTIAEIEAATNRFSDAKRIGEGGFGKVYKCRLDHTPVAIKVLQQNAYDKREEFLNEVEILSKLRHPHIVLLLGGCPERGSLVYEYMENGSLEDRLFCRNNTAPLPWFIRFRIVYEVALGLAFLHSLKPEPIVHRDLKPGNILLDGNYVSKIGDVGMARFMSCVVPDNVTEYKDTILAGTFYYMDPEYQRTGTLRPKSDLYAFGIIILQLLAGKSPQGLTTSVENAIKDGNIADILDKSIANWPLPDSEKLAIIALKCCRLRCRDRPDIQSEVMPELEELMNMTEIHFRLWRHNINAPSHYFCPILQEVMTDPHIAADGYTYEYRAIKAWTERHDISPITKNKLLHNRLTPNHSLKSAIHDWKSRATFSGSWKEETVENLRFNSGI